MCNPNIDEIKNKYDIKDVYKEYELGKLERLGIDIDPHKYDFVFSHIPVGKMIKIADHFNFSVIFDNKQKTSFYIHIPFCLRECTYCYFIKDVGTNVRCFEQGKKFSNDRLHTKPSEKDINEWVKLGLKYNDRVSEYLYYLRKEFQILETHFKNWEEIDSIYIGGGTPSFLFDDELDYLFKEIINPIRKNIGNSNLEIAMEIHPELMAVQYKQDKLENFNKTNNLNIDTIKLQKILDLGVNRLSFGIQTFDKNILRNINRDNRGHESLIKKLKDKNISNWNLDMIYGLPGQNLDSLKKDLKQIIELKPPSVTWYQLWYLPRKKEREIKLRMREFRDKIPSKKDIIKFKLFVHEVLKKNGYTNISGDWYVTKNRFYTQYEKDKVEAHGNIGIGIGVYQYYGDYVFENSSGNGYGDNLEWSEYYQKIDENKLPITWLRKVDSSELYLRKMIMGLKGQVAPEPIKIKEIEKNFLNNDKLEHIYKRIYQLIDREIFKENNENGTIHLAKKYWLFRDYVIIYLLEKYGWNIEKSGLLESLDGVDVYSAKDTFYYDSLPNILRGYYKREGKELKINKVSIAFFTAVFDENIGDYDLNFSSNYILEKGNYVKVVDKDNFDFIDEVIIKKKISSGKLTSNSFSFLNTFYTRPGNLRLPICIRVNDNDEYDPFDIPNIKLNSIDKTLVDFLQATELNYPDKKIRTNYNFVINYYKNLNIELTNEKNKSPMNNVDLHNRPLYIYHIPFFENYGVGGIELALDQVLTRIELINIKNDLLPFFIDRISQEINAFENYNINKHALKSAISSIMARNLSHIHGSHIEPGLQNRMEDFKKLLRERMTDAT